MWYADENLLVRCLTTWDQRPDAQQRVVRHVAAYQSPIGGLLGRAPGALHLLAPADMEAWGEARSATS